MTLHQEQVLKACQETCRLLIYEALIRIRGGLEGDADAGAFVADQWLRDTHASFERLHHALKELP
jgi:hypothetical protein